jgi:hypothetical protein
LQGEGRGDFGEGRFVWLENVMDHEFGNYSETKQEHFIFEFLEIEVFVCGFVIFFLENEFSKKIKKHLRTQSRLAGECFI